MELDGSFAKPPPAVRPIHSKVFVLISEQRTRTESGANERNQEKLELPTKRRSQINETRGGGGMWISQLLLKKLGGWAIPQLLENWWTGVNRRPNPSTGGRYLPLETNFSFRRKNCFPTLQELQQYRQLCCILKQSKVSISNFLSHFLRRSLMR